MNKAASYYSLENKELLEQCCETQSSLIKAGTDAYEKFLHKLVRTVLKKDKYTAEEIKDFSFVTKVSEPGRKWIAYKGTIIGEEKFYYDYIGNTATIRYEIEPTVY